MDYVIWILGTIHNITLTSALSRCAPPRSGKVFQPLDGRAGHG